MLKRSMWLIFLKLKMKWNGEKYVIMCLDLKGIQIKFQLFGISALPDSLCERLLSFPCFPVFPCLHCIPPFWIPQVDLSLNFICKVQLFLLKAAGRWAEVEPPPSPGSCAEPRTHSCRWHPCKPPGRCRDFKTQVEAKQTNKIWEMELKSKAHLSSLFA